MRDKNELRDSLRSATMLLMDVLHGRISIDDFVRIYDNFYYYEALDGHEADDEDKKILDKYREIISLHEEVQTSIVDLVYLGSDERKDEFLAAGRIDRDEAAKRLAHVVKKYNISLMWPVTNGKS